MNNKIARLHMAPLIAHRGARMLAPENTLAAMRKAAELGATWVEFDVMLSKDGEAIIMHDDSLVRTTDAGHVFVSDLNLAEIKQLDAGSWFSTEFAGEPVPSLKELLVCLRELGLRFNLEIKPTPGREIETAQVAIRELLANWPCDEIPPLVTSQSPKCMYAAFFEAPFLPIGGVMHTWDEIAVCHEWASDNGWVSMSVDHNLLDAETVSLLQTFVPLIMAYTVNDAPTARRLLDMGVVSAFSDVANLLSHKD